MTIEDPREDPRSFLHDLFKAALNAADPARVLPPCLPRPATNTRGGRTVVIAAGKAAAAMAQAIENHWQDPVEGLAVTRYGHAVPCRQVEVIEASHPVPDAAGQEAARRIFDLAQELGPDDLLLCLISGGGSALLTLPAKGITLADKQAVNRALLKSGATIAEMNCVRKHLSAIKGGRLAAAAAPARVLSLLISDVPGDDPGTIASGPTVPDETTFADARAILAAYAIDPPVAVKSLLERAADETPKPGNPCFEHVETRLIAWPQQSLEAAAAVAKAAGIIPVILGDAIEGEARSVAYDMAKTALEAQRSGLPAPACVLLSGGETTVTVRGNGRGGRNAEFLLALAVALDGAKGIYALACDTDGIDGTEDNAGAIIDPDTLLRAQMSGLDPKARLDNNDGYGVFSALGDLVMTGPTRTNVNDFRAILILPQP